MSEPRELGESFLAPLQRHVINLMCLDSGPAALQRFSGKNAIYNFSAFVVEVGERWLAISAGHIFRDLREAVSKGAILSDWQIDDSIVSMRPQLAYRISVDLERDVTWLYDEIPGIDYAYIELGPLTKQALFCEGIRAIPESIWAAEDIEDFGLWLLVGTPQQFSQLEAGQPIIKNHATIHIEHVSHVPTGLVDSEFRRLYAKIHFDSVMDQEHGFDIGGMSGGPVFGLRPTTEDTPYDYRLIGIQSKWNEKDHVAVCAAYPFLQTVAAQIKQCDDVSAPQSDG